jgi:hypothetical protein
MGAKPNREPAGREIRKIKVNVRPEPYRRIRDTETGLYKLSLRAPRVEVSRAADVDHLAALWTLSLGDGDLS